MFNRRDETRKLTWLFFLELTTDGGLKFTTRGLAHCIFPFKEAIIKFLPSEHKVCVWNKIDGLKYFIGSGKKRNLDGKDLQCELYQAIGVSVKFDNVVYVTDYKSSCIEIMSTDSHRKVFVLNRKVVAGVLYTRKKKKDLIPTIFKLISIYRNNIVPKISLGDARLT